MKRIILLFLAVASLCSCKKDGIDLFGTERFIYFNTVEKKHEIRFSFRYAKGETSAELFIPVAYSGRRYEEDRTYSVELVADSTSAVASEYILPDSYVVKGGQYSDSLKLVLKKTARLDNEEVRIRLRLVSDSNFSAAIRDSLQMDIYSTNQLAKPSWWNREVENAYLGEYSDKKFELFIDHGYSGDYGKLQSDEKRYWANVFKQWLIEQEESGNTQYDENGGKIEVPVIG